MGSLEGECICMEIEVGGGGGGGGYQENSGLKPLPAKDLCCWDNSLYKKYI